MQSCSFQQNLKAEGSKDMKIESMPKKKVDNQEF